jgi:ubiquinone/menaquinone biosynthesis C-methylase UbiE
MDALKKKVFEFWDEAACGEKLYLTDSEGRNAFDEHECVRYKLEPYIPEFAGFNRAVGKRVLEIGVGLGADHKRFAEAGAILTGVDLTPRAVSQTSRRLELYGLKSDLSVADAERLSFPDNSFDVVYSWGVIHHSPDPESAVREIFRVLVPGGEARIMIYHKLSIVGFALWIRYALLTLKPFTSLSDIYSEYLESPGTKAYTVQESKCLFKSFGSVEIKTVLTHGDLLASAAGQRHEGILLGIARAIWPRWIIKTFFQMFGLFMLITAKK